MDEILHIDGSYGEGGGQIIRTALSLSAITGRGVEIARVRAGRDKPGLKAQHLTAVRMAADLCAARVEGDAVGSTRLLFSPQSPVIPAVYQRDIGTAGAIALVVQTALIPLALADGPSSIRLTGGTHAQHAPSVDYLEAVYLPALRRVGIDSRLENPRAGFFPRGGGEVKVDISPAQELRPLDWSQRGDLLSITAIITTAGLPAHVAQRGAATIADSLANFGRLLKLDLREKPSFGPGAAVLLAVECENGHAGFISLGERGKPMEKVAQQACDDLHAWHKSGAACDEHLSDQLALPLALAPAESRWTTPTPTEHLRTVTWVIEQFLPVKFAIEEEDGEWLVVKREIE